ncbi:MAG: hypothetical protein QXF58_06630 [Desulfurococcaceae archaeon]
MIRESVDLSSLNRATASTYGTSLAAGISGNLEPDSKVGVMTLEK